MLWILLALLLGGLIGYWKGRRDALSKYADDIAADIRHKDAAAAERDIWGKHNDRRKPG